MMVMKINARLLAESVKFINHCYYDSSYTRERIFLGQRDTSKRTFNSYCLC